MAVRVPAVLLNSRPADTGQVEDTLAGVHPGDQDYHQAPQGKQALSDSELRKRLVEGLNEYKRQVLGAQRTRNAILGHTVSTASIVIFLQTAYLDNSVWDKMEKLYSKSTYCQDKYSIQQHFFFLSIQEK